MSEEKRTMELLAPAGSIEALRAAVFCGADAVYLGGGRFNARRNAQNFTEETLAEAIQFCHDRGVSAYVTVNTVQFDREMPAMAAYIRFLNQVGADALIVQDLGVAKLARSIAPALPLHASTQMTVASAEGAKLLGELGFSRVVLARELSAENLAAIASENVPALEVFVHGALCVSFSGQCYYSALLGGRSGNRGLCAQPCRLSYRKEGGKTAPLLSLKDLSLGANLTALGDLNISSLKIEGRMRRPEYVAAVCTAFRAAIDEKRNLSQAELANLAAVFSRQGFTDGYFTGNLQNMTGTRENEAFAGYGELQKLYAKEKVWKKFSVAVSGTFSLGKPATLTLSDGVRLVSVAGEIPGKAQQAGVTAERLAKNLTFGPSSPLLTEKMTLSVASALYYAAAWANDLRRRGQAAFLTARFPQNREEGATPVLPPAEKTGKTKFSASVRTPDQLAALLANEPPARLILPFSYEEKTWPALPKGPAYVLSLPKVLEPSMGQAISRKISRISPLFSGVLAGSLGTLAFAKATFPAHLKIYGDTGLNFTNSYALQEGKDLGLAETAVSFELTRRQIQDLNPALPIEALAYGRLPLMLLKRCVMENCDRCTGEAVLYDRRGEALLLTKEFGCQNQLWNGHVLWLADKLEEWQNVAFLRLVFTDETPERVAAVWQAYQNNVPCPPPKALTRGLYYRGVT